MSQPAAVSLAALTRSSPRCQRWSPSCVAKRVLATLRRPGDEAIERNGHVAGRAHVGPFVMIATYT